MARMRLAEPAWISLSLFDARGSMVQSWPGAISGAYDLRIDMSAQPPGVYLIVLHTDRAVAIRKVVKE
ncbi:MAG: T9SS type A sorting domain-containing protein [Saprospiraceae bacterium]|nr:T9SS type A sorting domain-containing protein [Saprospiraceae bacterium]